MKNRITFLFLLSIITICFSCRKDDDEQLSAEEVSIEEVSAMIGEDIFKSDIATAEIDSQDRLVISTTTTDSLRPYFILSIYKRDPGVYLFATPEVASAQYYPGFGVNELYYAQDGNIEITEHDPDKKRVKGTFDITFEEASFGTLVEVENGMFDVIYE